MDELEALRTRAQAQQTADARESHAAVQAAGGDVGEWTRRIGKAMGKGERRVDVYYRNEVHRIFSLFDKWSLNKKDTWKYIGSYGSGLTAVLGTKFNVFVKYDGAADPNVLEISVSW